MIAMDINIQIDGVAHELEADQIRQYLRLAVGRWMPVIITTTREYAAVDEYDTPKTGHGPTP